MSQKFQSSIQHRGDVSYVKLGGVIDEDNELSELVEKIPTGTAVIDLGEIERINSCGVRDWVNWLSKLETSGTRSVLVECSPAIVAQINLVNNFTGSGVVKSFYVPYFCPECDEEKVLLVETSDMGPPPHEPPTCRCDECDLVMDFDDMPDSYFAFLGNQRKLAEGEKSAVKELGRGSEPPSSDGKGGKVKSRQSSPQVGGQGSKPSVPSLPSIQRTSTTPASGPVAVATKSSSPGSGSKPQAGGSGPGSQPGNKSSQPSRPNLKAGGSRPPGAMGAGMSMSGNFALGGGPTTQQPPKSNALVFVLIGILVAAIGVLAYLVLTK